MAIDALMVYLRPKELYSSLKNHSQGHETHTYCSKEPNGTNVLNNRPLLPSRGHVWLVEEIFIAFDGYNISLETKV